MSFKYIQGFWYLRDNEMSNPNPLYRYKGANTNSGILEDYPII